MACPRCENINESIISALNSDQSPTYSQLTELLNEIKDFTSASNPHLIEPHKFFALNDHILAAIYIDYIKNRARDFYAVGVSFFGPNNDANRIASVDPYIGFDVISANLSVICLTLTTAAEAQIHSLS